VIPPVAVDAADVTPNDSYGGDSAALILAIVLPSPARTPATIIAAPRSRGSIAPEVANEAVALVVGVEVVFG
jgi:hypothetical protein